DPQFADPINNLAMMYEKAGNFDDALALLQQAVAINGNNSDYELNLGDVYLDKDQPDQALDAFQKASNLSPSDANVYNEMALTYERLGQKQDAEDTWQKVLQYAKKADILKQAKSHLEYLQAQS
ncbi:MAG: tetratricopeptide repeat protein, partial [bacterium]